MSSQPNLTMSASLNAAAIDLDVPVARIGFSELAGWAEDDHAAAFAAFRKGCPIVVERPPKRRKIDVDGAQFARICGEALALPETLERDQARAFFETWFDPHRAGSGNDAFFTGYFEPEVAGSRERGGAYQYPLYRRPKDLVKIDKTNRPPELDPAVRFARQTDDGVVAYFERREIESGALDGLVLELFWLARPIDAFFVHVQGSARIRLTDGSLMRVAFDGKSGHDYTSIGRVLVGGGALSEAEASMETIRAWLAAHPDAAREVMWQNRSFIFFRVTDVPSEDLGPIGAAGIALTAERSLAVDRSWHPFHVPVWVDVELPIGPAGAFRRHRRLTVAQDTGSAIVGPARGDIFFGSGEEAGALAGRVKHFGDLVVLVPRMVPRDAP